MRALSKAIAVTSVAGLLTGFSGTASFAFGSGGHAGGALHGGSGGFHTGGAPAGGWHGGASGWHGGGGGWGPAVGLGVAGGLAAGAIGGSYYANSYGDNCVQYQPAYDAYGNYIGSQAINVCGP
jgi:hypothetical protein